MVVWDVPIVICSFLEERSFFSRLTALIDCSMIISRCLWNSRSQGSENRNGSRMFIQVSVSTVMKSCRTIRIRADKSSECKYHRTSMEKKNSMNGRPRKGAGPPG